MKFPKLGERGAVYPYLVFFVIVVFSAIIWIVFNELILHIGDWHATAGGEDTGFTWPFLVSLCRFTPAVILLGAVVWAIVQSHRGTGVAG